MSTVQLKLSDFQADLLQSNLKVTNHEKPLCGRGYGLQKIHNNTVYYIDVSLYYQLDDEQNPVAPDDRDVHFALVNVRKGDIHEGGWSYAFDSLKAKERFLDHVKKLVA